MGHDPVAALRWFGVAAAQGHLAAINMVGRCHDLGWGTPVDKVVAARWFKRAAERGLDWGMYNWGTALALGAGVPEDKAAALTWFERAAALGNAKAINFIGSFHEDGWVVPRDVGRAAGYYELAAAGRDFRGQFNHGRMLVAARPGRGRVTLVRACAGGWERALPGTGARMAGAASLDLHPLMMIIPNLLTPTEVIQVRALIDPAEWVDGNATSGSQSALAKRNEQLPEDGDAARAAGNIVLDALARSALFVAAALPLRVYPPLFNRYGAGQGFGDHVDSAVRIRRGSDFRIRTDLSATLFLADPNSFDGGELVVSEGPGVKAAAGDMVLYPASSVHRVEPVTRGVRVASFFWVQSMVRSESDRAMLFELDRAVQGLGTTQGAGHPEIVRLTGVYHNLLRRCAEL